MPFHSWSVATRRAAALTIFAICGLVSSLVPSVHADVANAAISVDRAEYLPGDTVTFSGTGWDGCGDVGIRLDGEFVVVVSPDPIGSFQGTLIAPTELGIHRVLGDGDPCNDVATFTVVAEGGEQVSFCHRTASVSNPYNLITTDANSIVKAGHGGHTGPIFPNEGPNGKWGDIIPPFDYSGGHYPGLNWPEGQAVINAACVVHEIVPPEPPDETTTTAAASTSAPTSTSSTSTTTPSGSSTSVGTSTSITSTSTSSTSTSLPVSSTTGTTQAGATTTSPAETENIPTTLPGATTVPGVTPDTPVPTVAVESEAPPPLALPPDGGDLVVVQAFVIAPGNRVVILGVLNERQRGLLKALLLKKIANTGSDESDLVVGALIALLTGALLVGVAARRRRAPI